MLHFIDTMRKITHQITQPLTWLLEPPRNFYSHYFRNWGRYLPRIGLFLNWITHAVHTLRCIPTPCLLFSHKTCSMNLTTLSQCSQLRSIILLLLVASTYAFFLSESIDPCYSCNKYHWIRDHGVRRGYQELTWTLHKRSFGFYIFQIRVNPTISLLHIGVYSVSWP